MTGYSPRLAALSQLSHLDLLAVYVQVCPASLAPVGGLNRDQLIAAILAAPITIPATAREEYESRLWHRFPRADPAVIEQWVAVWEDTQAATMLERRRVLAGIGG